MTLAFGSQHELAWVARRALSADSLGGDRVNLDIHPADDMLINHINGQPTAEGVISAYFAVSLQVQGVVDQVVADHLGGWDRVGSVLDFAGGYGRCTRMIVTRVAPETVWVGEIQHDAVEFQQDTFGVHGLRSYADGIEDIELPDFDLVIVVSLFTHLPRTTWIAWLSRLWSLVGAGGALVFSTHAAEVAPPEFVFTDGFAFRPLTEVDVLDVSDYGSTFTTTDFVCSAIADVCGAEAVAVVQHLPLAFGGVQDVWCVPRGTAPTQADRAAAISPQQGDPLAERRSEVGAPVENWSDYPGVNAIIDPAEQDGESVVLRGWAARCGSHATAHRATVRAQLDGNAVSVACGLQRADVARYFGRPGDLVLAFSGWRLEIPTDTDGAARLVVRADDRVILDATMAEILARQ